MAEAAGADGARIVIGARTERALGGADDLLGRFLANRGDRTLQAYSVDIEDFARFVDRDPADAVTDLLSAGPGPGRLLVMDYAIHLRERGRASATISRRLATLRSLARMAHHLGLVEWLLQVPSEEEISRAIEQRAEDDTHYLFPRHPGEIDRLDVQHYALREALGANYLAQIERPLRVLDVGSGTGQWAFEICRTFPEALVVGFDLVGSKPDPPPGYRLVRGNLLHGLPFASDRFDFVHQRLLVAGIPVSSWPAVVADLVRVTRPGGWVELVEVRMTLERAGPATDRLNQLARGIAATLGLDASSQVFDALDGYLRNAGLADVSRREVSMPIGEWGGRVGSMLASDIRAAFARLCEVLQARSAISAEESRGLIQRAQVECEEYRTVGHCAIAVGSKAIQAEA